MDEPITADHAFQMAERIELKGQQFYILAANLIRASGARQTLSMLGDMEAQHASRFAAMRKRLGSQLAPGIDPDGETAAYLKALLAGKFFDDQIGPQDYLRGGESRQDILLTAIGMEKETIVFYEGVKQIVAAKEDREALEAIIGEEMGHISKLAGMLDPHIQ